MYPTDRRARQAHQAQEVQRTGELQPQARPARPQDDQMQPGARPIPPAWNSRPGSLMQRAASATGAQPGWPGGSASQRGAAPPGQAVRAAAPAGPRQQPVSYAARQAFKAGTVATPELFDEQRAAQRASGQPLTPSPQAQQLPVGGVMPVDPVRQQALASLADPSATFGAKNLTKDAAFSAINDIRAKGFTNSNDIANYLGRDYGITDPRVRGVLMEEWLNQYQPEKVAASNAAASAAQRKAALGAVEYYKGIGQQAPASVLQQAGLAQQQAAAPAAPQFTGDTGQLERAVAEALAQGATIAQAKQAAFDRYGVNQDQWNAINWANVPGGSTR